MERYWCWSGEFFGDDVVVERRLWANIRLPRAKAGAATIERRGDKRPTFEANQRALRMKPVWPLRDWTT